MKTVIILAGLIALALGRPQQKLKTIGLNDKFLAMQMKVLGLLENVRQVNRDAEYYKVAMDFDLEKNIDSFTNKDVVKKFLFHWEKGFIDKSHVFSISYDHQREETIALFHLFYNAIDFETFYKIAAKTRVFLNPGQFLYAFYIAVIQRFDTLDIVLPAPYEIYPEMFLNMDSVNKLNLVKDQEGISFLNPEQAKFLGLVQEDDQIVLYANYSSNLVNSNDEQRLTYFTEDIGLNSYYYWFHSKSPFWWKGDKFEPVEQRCGEIYYFFYKQLLNRYYFERLTNGLGPVGEFSWFSPIPTGYYPLLSTTMYPLVQRPDSYNIFVEDNYDSVKFLDSFEKSFLQYLENSHFNAFDQENDFHYLKTINFVVGNFWQYNAFKEVDTKTYQRSYETTARHLLSGAPHPVNKYSFLPSALDFYQTSMRDPVFYQLYNRIISYIIQFKKHLNPHKPEALNFNGVEIEEVKVDKLVTFFDYFDFNATNAVYFKQEALKAYPYSYIVRQPRLNHKDFNIKFQLKSKVESEAVFRVFLGPKYDSNGYPILLEDNWNHFLLLDWFTHKLVAGKNEITRSSEEFFFFREDSVSTDYLMKMLQEGSIPLHMSQNFDNQPNRMMLPRGTKDGFPFQIFVIAYPEVFPKELLPFEGCMLDVKSYSYPFDRPVYSEASFIQPNMFFKDVSIFHEGEMFPYKLNVPSYFEHNNQVSGRLEIPVD